MRKLTLLSILAVSAGANAVLINFDDLANGTVVSNQYAGVTFSSGGRTGANELGSGFNYASNSDRTAGTDGGAGYQASDKNILHTFGGWLNEDGDPVITLTFSTAIKSISALFLGINSADAKYTRLIARNGGMDVAVASATSNGGSRQTLSLTNLNVTQIQMTPGYFGDWVGIDNIEYELVPEPATMIALGLGAAAMMRRRRK